MSRHTTIAIAATLVALTCATAVVSAQDAESERSTLFGRLESLRDSFLSRGDDSNQSFSRRESYTDRHRAAIEGPPSSHESTMNSPPPAFSPRVAELPPPVGQATVTPSNRVPAAAGVPSATPVAEQPQTPIHGIPRRIRPSDAPSVAPTDAPNVTLGTPAVPASPTARREPAPAATILDSDDGFVGPEDLPKQSSRRVVKDSSPRLAPSVERPLAEPASETEKPFVVVAPAEAPQFDDQSEEPTEQVAAETAAPETSVQQVAERTDRAQPPTAVAAPEAPGAEMLFAHKSPILNVQTLGPRDTVIGKEATYMIRVQNLGGVGAEGVVVNIDVPEWAEVTSLQPSRGTTRVEEGEGGEPAMKWQVGALPGQSQEMLTLKLIPRESRPFDLAVNWTFTPIRSETLIEVMEPKLKLAISGPVDVLYGETKVYRLTVSNPGTGAADNVKVQLLPIDGATDVAASQNLGTLAAGESRALEIELTARQAGAVIIRANASGDNGLAAEVAEQILVRRAELKVELVGPEAKFAGTATGYRLRVTNPGDAPAEGIELQAYLPSGAKYLSATGGGRLDEAARRIDWNIGSLRPGEERLLDVQCVLNTPGNNSLRVSATAEGDLTDAGSVNTQVEALADLKLEVLDPSGPVPAGEDAVYQVRLINRGTKAARNVDVVAFFSKGIEPFAVTGAPHEIGAGQVAFLPIESVPAGGELVLTITARAEVGGNHIFRAEVRCEDVGVRLAAEETTRYYESIAGRPIRTATLPEAPQDAAPLETPQDSDKEPAEPAADEASEPLPTASDLGERY